MQHQIAIIKTIFGLRIEGDEMIFFLAGSGHHADIVTTNQRIQTRNPSQRRFRCNKPELSIFAQCIFHARFDADADFNFTQIFAEVDILYCAHFNALITNGRASGHNAVRRHEVNGHGIAAIFIAPPDQPTCNHQCDQRQQPERRDTTFCFNLRFSLRSGRFLTHVHPKVIGCPAIPQQE